MLTRGGQALLGGTLLAGALLAAPLAGTARASLTYCTSDPVITLSNGAVLDLDATIADSTADVQQVTYVVHAPAGTRMLTLVKTGGLMGLKETVQFSATDPANTYDTTTTVSTGQKGVAVTASTKVVSALGVTLGFKSISGLSGQTLLVHITSLL
jgi:hypothetical protein